MNVIRGVSTNPAQPATSPLPLANGVFLELRGGDFRMPYGAGDWFTPPYFTKCWRKHWSRAWIPFVAYRWGNRGGYIGAKIYGADSPSYAGWLAPGEDYLGSQALMLSCRPFATLEEGE